MQLENLVYFNRLKHSKVVISDFQLAKLENGLIKDPCGTPEYLGEQHKTLPPLKMLFSQSKDITLGKKAEHVKFHLTL